LLLQKNTAMSQLKSKADASFDSSKKEPEHVALVTTPPLPNRLPQTPPSSRRVCIVYRRPTCWFDNVVSVLGRTGDYCHCEVWFPDWVYKNRPGWRFTNFMFEPMQMTDDAWVTYTSEPDLYAAHTLWMSTSAYRGLLEWFRARVALKTQYNYRSVARFVLPHCLQASEDTETVPCTRMFCSEAVVLGLKHAVEPEHEIGQVFAPLVACSTKPGDIANALNPLYNDPMPISLIAGKRSVVGNT
jgi:hypothetical protein